MRTIAAPTRWVAVGLLSLAACYTGTHFRGWLYDGERLIDHGILSRPRYEAQFAAILLNGPGTYSYRFSRFPAAEAMIILVTPDKPAVEQLLNLPVTLRLRVVDQAGITYCDGIGSPRVYVTEGLKIIESDALDGLWHTSCDRLQLRACYPCHLDISIGPVDPATPPLRLIPTLQGGGIAVP